MQQINIVISGFTPYDGIDVNPAVLVPVALAEYWNDPSQSVALSDDLLQDVSMSVTTVTLPVSFANAWPMLLNAIEQANPDIVIATGLKRSARGVLLERCATNLMDAAKPDADNVIPPRRPINPEGPAAYWTRRRCVRFCAISPNMRFRRVEFGCGHVRRNSLFYHLLDWSQRRKSAFCRVS